VKRPVIAISAAALLLSMWPGTAFGTAISGVLDQSNVAVSATSHSGATEAQTFTAGITGQLTAVELWAEYVPPLVAAPGGVQPNPAPIISVGIYGAAAGIPTGSPLSSTSGTPVGSAGWVVFTLSTPIPVVSGTQYAIVFTISPYANVFLAGSYSGGTRVSQVSSSWVKNAGDDYAFQTYVYAQYTSVHWSQGQVLAGVDTTVTLTETFHFPGVDPQSVGATWALVTPALPTWFTPTGVVCSAEVGDCDKDHLGPAKFMPVQHTASALVVTVAITGTTHPAAGDLGSTGTGTGDGCSVAVSAEPIPFLCFEASDDLLVVDHITTPPPGTTEQAPAGTGTSAPWLLPATLLGLLGLALAVNRRRLLDR
jgi:hypothetical protein